MTKTGSEDKVQNLNTRISLVERFLQAKEIGKQHPTEMVQQCEQLLEIRNSDAAVRAGDLYAVIISHWYTVNDMDQAHSWLGRMQQRGIRADNFLTRTVVDSILEATGNASPPQGSGGHQQQQWQDDDGEEMEEELDEEIASDEDM
jgi:intraflagellar transport protein 140